MRLPIDVGLNNEKPHSNLCWPPSLPQQQQQQQQQQQPSLAPLPPAWQPANDDGLTQRGCLNFSRFAGMYEI